MPKLGHRTEKWDMLSPVHAHWHWHWGVDWAVQSAAVSTALEISNDRSYLIANVWIVGVTREMMFR